MGRRTLAAGAAAVILIGWGAAAAAQDSARGWTPARTADGQPDIQGVWTNYDNTPFETPDDADLERLAPLAYWFPGTNDPDRLRAAAARPRQDSQRIGFADGPSAALRNAPRRSMVVDPPTGRVPVRAEAEATRDYNLVNLTDSWLNHTPWERCITRGVPGGIFPGGYGAGYQILQAPGYVVIFYEMIHEARIIPLDGPHLPDAIRQWNGDPRGRWEGDTLVVETTNYNDKGTIGTNIATARHPRPAADRGAAPGGALHAVRARHYRLRGDDRRPRLVHPHLDRGHAAQPGPDVPDLRVRLPRGELRPGEQPQRGARGGRGRRQVGRARGYFPAGCQAGVPSSQRLSVSARWSEPSAFMMNSSP